MISEILRKIHLKWKRKELKEANKQPLTLHRGSLKAPTKKK